MIPKCPNPKFGGTSFERVTQEIGGRGFKHVSFVICSGCGVIVGGQDVLNVMDLLVEQNKVINKLARTRQLREDYSP